MSMISVIGETSDTPIPSWALGFALECSQHMRCPADSCTRRCAQRSIRGDRRPSDGARCRPRPRRAASRAPSRRRRRARALEHLQRSAARTSCAWRRCRCRAAPGRTRGRAGAVVDLHALDLVGGHRRRRLADRAAVAGEADVLDRAVVGDVSSTAARRRRAGCGPRTRGRAGQLGPSCGGACSARGSPRGRGRPC